MILNDILQISSKVDEMVFELPIQPNVQVLITQNDIADLVNHTNGQKLKRYLRQVFVTHFGGRHLTFFRYCRSSND